MNMAPFSPPLDALVAVHMEKLSHTFLETRSLLAAAETLLLVQEDDCKGG